ncbi:unnamed protein product [Acanthosepion pharaonis]|uniref:Uncharacterized protein n=1 Tax=Acanthosepion pharaonis TaxID=158019 RepID=A0A812BGH0_ACAPH|nr:unnamed protein product [Sepia pharaonis]
MFYLGSFSLPHPLKCHTRTFQPHFDRSSPFIPFYPLLVTATLLPFAESLNHQALSLHIDFPAWFPTLTSKRKPAISVNVFPLITSTTSPSRSVKSYLPEVERHFRSFHFLFVSSCLPVFFGHLPSLVDFLLSFIFFSFYSNFLHLSRYPIFTSDLIATSLSFPFHILSSTVFFFYYKIYFFFLLWI